MMTQRQIQAARRADFRRAARAKGTVTDGQLRGRAIYATGRVIEYRGLEFSSTRAERATAAYIVMEDDGTWTEVNPIRFWRV